ncbi:MAG: hypothetical protein PHY43_14610, partial [Verrucomicrobiales bacterium]|nr:hypothetical protein [Verrucomicrobiales bacterium]
MPLHFIKHLRCRAWFARGLFCFFAGLALAASAQSDSMDTFGGSPDSSKFIWIERDAPDWTRHFRIGAMVGMNISANFKTKGTFNVSGNNPAAGVYDDGYVREDSTGNAFGQTSNWGYDNASQYNPATQTLLMHGASSYSTSGSSKDNGSAFAGFDMAYGDNLWYWKHARVGWEFGFGLLPINITDNSPMSATVKQSTFSFNTSNPDNAPIPGAPYQGGFDRQGGDWTIPGTPASVATTNTAGTVTGSRELDVMLYTFRLGPTFYWDLNEYFGVQLGAGPAFGIVSGTYKFNETITTSVSSTKNHGSFDFTDLTYGGYVNGTLLYHVINDADLYIGAQYMPMGNASF